MFHNTYNSHKKILEKLKELCPGISYRMWWKKGKNAVRLRTGGGADSDLIFIYHSDQEWILQTATMYKASEEK